MSDGGLREQLLEYFDQVIAAPDDEWRRPAYLGNHKPTELFVNVGVMRSDERRDRIDILPAELEYKLDDSDR